ncbi:BNR-4 repeat-containing protein [Candidatus Daviesbacteria bacterium]|nr:BNR-4 repeat-containing protein [Candidatus Daviesbacteria bacterium]
MVNFASKRLFRVYFLGESGVIHIFLLLLLLLGIGLGVYLVQNKTNIFPKAALEQPSLNWSVDTDFDPNRNFSTVSKLSRNISSGLMATPLAFHNGDILACFISEDLKTMVAKSSDGGKNWSYNQVSVNVGDDPHFFCSLGVDKDGYIHIAYDMQNVPLKYKKSDNPNDINSFSPSSMTGTAEDRVTYPSFHKSPNGDLYFLYRNGGSGTGDLYIKRYDSLNKVWENFATPLILGSSSTPAKSPYWGNIVWDKNGDMHIAWTFRDSQMQQNSNLYYAKYNQSLKRWEKSDGSVYTLPITPQTAEAVVVLDYSQNLAESNGIYIDSFNHPHIAYIKNAASGKTEVFYTSFNGSSWVNKQVTNLNPDRAFYTGLNAPQLVVDDKNKVYIFYTDPIGEDLIAPGDLYISVSPDNGESWDTIKTSYPKSRGFNYDVASFRETGKLWFLYQETLDKFGNLFLLGGVSPEEFANVSSYANTSSLLAKKGEVKLENKLVGFWKFDETGGEALDSSGNNLNGITQVGRGVLGKVLNSYSFGGFGSVRVASDPLLNFDKADFTVEAWIKTTTPSGIVVSKYQQGRTPGFTLALNNEGKLQAQIRDGTGTGDGPDELAYVSGETALTDDNWHHIAAVFDRGGSLTIYVDGRQDAAALDISKISDSISNTRALVIGARDSDPEGNYYKGLIDEVALVRGVLTPEEFNFTKDYSVNSFIKPDKGTYTSYYKKMATGFYRDLTVDTLLNGGSVRAVVETSTDRFKTILGSQEIILSEGIKVYPLALQGSANGEEVRVTFELTSLTGASPVIRSFIVSKTVLSSPTPSLDKKPLGLFKFDDNKGDVAINSGSLGSVIDGKLTNIKNTDKSGWTDLGKINGALMFDGNDDFVDLGSNSNLAVDSSLTVVSWFKTASKKPGFIIDRNGPVSTNYRLMVNQYGAKNTVGSKYCKVNKVCGNLHFSNGVNLVLESKKNVNDGNWHHTALVYDSTSRAILLFVDGVLEAGPIPVGKSGKLVDLNNKTFIGVRGNGQKATDGNFEGILDDVRIYNQALSQQEINNLIGSF